MNKEQLIEAMATKANISKKAASDALETMLNSITNSLKSGDSVTLTGFGTFGSSRRAARQGRNPRTGETVQIPARTVPRFKAGKGLRDALR
ncbi:MAG: HU family DNA-binding protein [Patescibacteria group bacterium]